MRLNGIPAVYRDLWPKNTDINFTGEKNMSWSPWGTFSTNNIHCYTDDYRFESIWRKPEYTLKRVLELNYVLSPDFTMYPGASDYVNTWQLYRAMSVFSYWQNMGVNVIPSINWSTPLHILNNKELYPQFSVIAVRGPANRYKNEWYAGAETIKKLINPKIILHFGQALGLDVWEDAAINYPLRSKK